MEERSPSDHADIQQQYDDTESRFEEGMARMALYHQHCQDPVIFRSLGEVRGKSLLDLACGNGFYTRRFRSECGADPVVGFDLSPMLIQQAQRAEQDEPLGIEYLVGDVTTLELDRRFAVLVTNTPDNENWPDLQFQSGEIAFGSNRKEFGNTQGDYEIWVANSDFTSVMHLDPTIATQNYRDRTPSWSRDVSAGVRLAYSSEDDSGQFVIRLLHSGGALSMLTTGANPRFNPTDGDWIVFADYQGLAASIYKTTTTPGAARIPLSTDPQTLGGADWGVSDKIVYVRSDNFSDIWIMDADGSHQQSLISTPSPEYGPRWSPDGDRVAFGSHRFARFNIFVFHMSAVGNGQR